MGHFGIFLRTSFILASAAMALAGCTPPAAVRPGDKAEISFACRLPGGELAATTRPDTAVAGERKSLLYLSRTGPETVAVTAGPQAPDAAKQDRLPFEQEIVQRLALIIPGLKEGERTQRVLEAERYPVSSPNEKFVKLATVRKRQKEMRLTREEYATRTGKSPDAGQPLVLDRLVPGKVTEVTEKEVVVRFTPVGEKDLVTPFGPVSVRELPDHYELTIAAEQGRLVRTGGMAGRITAVDDKAITIDYGHPFAGEKLNCDVEVVKVEPAPAPQPPNAR